MTSIRKRLRHRLLVGLSALFAALGVGLYLLTGHLLTAQFDHALEAKARVLGALVKQQSDGSFDVDFAEEPMPEFGRARDPEYFELWLASGRSERSESLGGRHLPRPLPGHDRVASFAVDLPDGRPGRALALRFLPLTEEEAHAGEPALRSSPSRVEATLVLARGRADLDGALRGVSGAIAATGLLLLLGAALIVSGAVTRGLRPLDRVADQATRIDATSLDARFPVADVPDELGAITGRLNDLLARLQGSFERERRFSADVAHELRTPIAELRSLAEVALRYPAGGEPESGSYRDVLDVAVQMERMVTNLLALARCDAGRQEVVTERVELAEAVKDAWRPFEEGARARGLRASFTMPPGAAARTDRHLLASILGNLFSNAVEYAPAGGRVSCTAEPDAGGVSLAIANSATGLAADDLSHLFEPFWRKDPARTERTHAGLGLALVSAFAKLAGIDVRADLPEPDHFRIRLRFETA